MGKTLQAESGAGAWPKEGWTRIPFWIYTDPDLFQREMDTFFYGPSWNYVGLDCEIPEPGSFKRSWIGERQVVVVRDKDGSIVVHENRCAHRGARFCWNNKGKVDSFTCPYHQWNFALNGKLQGVPLKRGALGKGGMPSDFDATQHGLKSLRVHVEGGSIWATFDPNAPSFAEYCGPQMHGYVQRLFKGRPLKLLGYNRQFIPSNWKMYIENLKDPYHATLLHSFLITFGLWRADTQSESIPTEGGKHGIMISRNVGKKESAATSEISASRASSSCWTWTASRPGRSSTTARSSGSRCSRASCCISRPTRSACGRSSRRASTASSSRGRTTAMPTKTLK